MTNDYVPQDLFDYFQYCFSLYFIEFSTWDNGQFFTVQIHVGKIDKNMKHKYALRIDQNHA